MRKFLNNIVLSQNIDLTQKSDSDLLNFFDNPDNFYVKDSRGELFTAGKTHNYFISLTHGEYKLPDGGKNYLIKNNDKYLRLLKNFSDFGTKSIAEGMNLPEKQIIRNEYSRGIGDCNRDMNDRSDTGYIRKTDFSGNVLLSDLSLFSDVGKSHYLEYHKSISDSLEDIEASGKKSFLFDLHDTGVMLMDLDASQDRIKYDLFPSISIANLDGCSCSNEILKYFGEQITKYLGFPVMLNEPYKGGYVTKYHGVDSVEGKSIDRNVIQIELARFLYMKESAQEVDSERAEIIGDGLNRAMRDTVSKFS